MSHHENYEKLLIFFSRSFHIIALFCSYVKVYRE